MKRMLAVLVATVVVIFAKVDAFAGSNYLSDSHITVKVDLPEMVRHLQGVGWKAVPETKWYHAYIGEYGPEDDTAVHSKGILISPTSDDPAVRQSRKYCAKWYSYELEGYASKAVSRLSDLSAYLQEGKIDNGGLRLIGSSGSGVDRVEVYGIPVGKQPFEAGDLYAIYNGIVIKNPGGREVNLFRIVDAVSMATWLPSVNDKMVWSGFQVKEVVIQPLN